MVNRMATGIVRAGRVAVSAVGLAVVLALVLGVATTALAGTGVGATFNLGKVNSVSALSTLVGGTAGPMLKVDNNGSGTALDLQVGPSTTPPADKAAAPMQVDSQAKVANLNADEIDGRDSSEFAAGINGKATDAVHADSATSAQSAQNAQNADALGGKDASQFAQVTKLKFTTNAISGQGALPKEGTFTSNGGTLLVSAAGSGYRSSVNTTRDDGVIGMLIYVDGQFRDSAAVYTNGADSHKAFVNADFTLHLAAGTHTIRLEPWTNSAACGTSAETNWNACTTTDNGDFFSVSILEIP